MNYDLCSWGTEGEQESETTAKTMTRSREQVTEWKKED